MGCKLLIFGVMQKKYWRYYNSDVSCCTRC